MVVAKKTYRAHVVVVPYPLQGHINPILQFAKRLASKGVKATVATAVYTVSSISVPSVSVEPISDGFDQSGLAQAGFNVDLYTESFRINGSKTLAQLIDKYRTTESPVSCVIYDSFLPWGLDVARQNGVWAAAFFTNNMTTCSVMARVHNGSLHLPIDPDSEPFRIRGLPPLNFVDLPSFITRHRLSHPAHLSVLLDQFSNHKEADWLFLNSFEGLETQDNGAEDSEVFPGELIGPMIPSAYLDGRIKDDKGYGSSLWKPLCKECAEWLETKPAGSVAFVSFGSMCLMSEKQMQEIAFGLEESGLYFLWVIKDASIAKLPTGFVKSTKDKALMVPWCNQLEVLAHEAVGCFLTHCGWNSTLEGLSLGVPMVGLPQWSDQFCDAKFIESVWKVGLWAKGDAGEGVVRGEEIAKCLKEVVEWEKSKEIRKNAWKWKQLAKEAISKGGSSDKCIERFVESLAYA